MKSLFALFVSSLAVCTYGQVGNLRSITLPTLPLIGNSTQLQSAIDNMNNMTNAFNTQLANAEQTMYNVTQSILTPIVAEVPTEIIQNMMNGSVFSNIDPSLVPALDDLKSLYNNSLAVQFLRSLVNTTDTNSTNTNTTNTNTTNTNTTDTNSTNTNTTNTNSTDTNSTNTNTTNTNSTDTNSTNTNTTNTNSTDTNSTNTNTTNTNSTDTNSTDTNSTDINAAEIIANDITTLLYDEALPLITGQEVTNSTDTTTLAPIDIFNQLLNRTNTGIVGAVNTTVTVAANALNGTVHGFANVMNSTLSTLYNTINGTLRSNTIL